MTRGLFVIGTDTDVGKTTVSVGLVSAWADGGRRVGVMKPFETGGGDDALRLIRATRRDLPIGLVNPYRFALPAAPEVAARREGVRIELGRIDDAYATLSADADVMVVEGAGGLLVPLAGGLVMADLVQRLGLPILLVARTRLGTINHTLLTAEVARRRGLRVLGVVFSRTVRSVGPEESDTVATIVRFGELRSFGVLPYVPASARNDEHKLADYVSRSVQLDGLFKLL